MNLMEVDDSAGAKRQVSQINFKRKCKKKFNVPPNDGIIH